MSLTSRIATRARAANRRLRRKLATFSRDGEGIAATEFALVLPIMMTMYFGMVEMSQAVGHDRKSVLLSRTLADMVTQSLAITNTDMTTIFNAGSSVLSPYDVDKIAMRVTSFLIDGNGNAFVDWSDVKNVNSPTPYGQRNRCSAGNAIIPAALRTPRSSLVQSEVTIKHLPTIGYVLVTSGVDMKESLFMRPRVSSAVGRQGVPTTNCPGFVP